MRMKVVGQIREGRNTQIVTLEQLAYPCRCPLIEDGSVEVAPGADGDVERREAVDRRPTSYVRQ
jgi:hypothetical protein